MPMYINTNVPSLTVQRNMASGSNALNTVYARLSSGLRINSAEDDPAGLGITNRMTAQIRGLTQAVRNANDGISVSQVAEGAMSEDANMLQRISELSVQAANATNSDSDRQSLQEEASQLLSEIDRIAQQTEFNGWPMLSGNQQPLVFQVGAKEGQTIQVNLADARANTLLAQPVASDPNSPVSVTNQPIEGLTITAPNPPLAGSQLFSASLGPMVNAVASGNTALAATQPYASTVDSANVVRNMAVAAGVDPTTAKGINATTCLSATAAAALIAAQGSTLTDPPTETQVVTVLGDAGVNVTKDATTGLYNNSVVQAAVYAANGFSADGVTQLVAGKTSDGVIAAAIATESLSGVVDNTDKARVLAAGMYAVSKGVPSQYDAVAGTSGSLASIDPTSSPTSLVNSAVRYKDANGEPVIKDVPVGNILSVIKVFNDAITKGKTVDQIAQMAVDADAGKNLKFDQAKIIAQAGVVAAQTGSLSGAINAGISMATVLGARNAAVSASQRPIPGEQVTVPRWLINTSGQNKYPPVPLVDVTGKTIPTDPTLKFDPPNTNGTNPPLTGQAAAGRMLSVVLNAINRVSSVRGELGAIESRFTSNISNLNNVVENLSAARSRIQDTDVAAETANLTKLSILQQAGTAILAQANQLPQLALQLLK